jgi:hypothetical protein
LPKALDTVDGIGKGIATAILTVAYPQRYGVWNNTSEGALRKSGLWPTSERGEGIGGQYEKINGVLGRIVSDLGTDFWTLDAVWWYLLDPEAMPPLVLEIGGEVAKQGESFALERQLEEFLLENWDRTPLAKEWVIYSTPDDREAGHQFPTDIGPIDILAKHRTESRFLVIELKRKQTTDQTIGQALRYMGWVRKHLAKSGETVEALIIGHTAEKGALYALATVPQVRMMTYEVEFRLRGVEGLP